MKELLCAGTGSAFRQYRTYKNYVTNTVIETLTYLI